MQIIQFLQKQISEKRLPQSLTLEGQNQELLISTAQEIIRLLCCPNQSYPSDDCDYCLKQKNWFDVLWIGDGATEIGKEVIQTMIQKMQLSALESHGQKIYVIQNAENLKTIASNSLLKFLEEPPHDTYAILLTKDRGRVLPTIKSRCQNFRVNSSQSFASQNAFDDLLRQNDISELMLGSMYLKETTPDELIRMAEQSLTKTIWPLFPQWAEPTLQLIADLKSQVSNKLALDHYFITLCRGADENS
ncbi:DNA polymerase-3 subunit delta' [Entomoplasma freundtii]|uniref:DNA polymerase III subunit delta n=1 Tax=Entomoplasma freundtii TaxID=74700 RepID=A0A2K8NSE0_9MOLU|nr:hypothetical protein [Entomoplasma freundtii]ATZ16719.1 DNA polymerase III subunit delta' [Entomoplasma freundtii]TDY58114.1 DNA polymerase-3 subunit delta' [Entomoplasma freundtii]